LVAFLIPLIEKIKASSWENYGFYELIYIYKAFVSSWVISSCVFLYVNYSCFMLSLYVNNQKSEMISFLSILRVCTTYLIKLKFSWLLPYNFVFH
jgi:hypothetical protein